MVKRIIIASAVFVLLYTISYLIFRANNTEIWAKNGKSYVIFPQSKMWLYYFYRPATYIDGKVSDMNFHIGPHQE